MNQDQLIAHLVVLLRTAPAPDVVYHYTTPVGLLSIVEKSRIWATDVRYLSDAQEFEYTLTFARDSLTKLKSGASAEDLRLLNECETTLSVAPRVRLYATSFSRNGNLLSQWRAYCPPTGGFSVGIRSQLLEEAAGTVLFPCVYDRERQGFLFGEIIRSILNDWRARPGEEAEPEILKRLLGHAVDFFTTTLLLAAVFKDPNFGEEEEWRLTARSNADGTPTPLFRPGRSGIVPYIDFELQPPGKPLRIDQIIVGPNPHPELASQAIVSLLGSHGVVHDGVVPCGIPYRTW